MDSKFKIVYIAKNNDDQYEERVYWSGHSFLKFMHNLFMVLIDRKYHFVSISWRIK